MSLLDLGPDIVSVYPEVESTDDYGNRVMVPSESPVTVRGRWQASTSDEAADEGQQTNTFYRFICRDFPAGPYARVEFDGSDWDVVGDPKIHRGSAMTRHATVRLKERAPNGVS